MPRAIVSIVPGDTVPRPSAGPLQAIVLYEEQFADPFHRFATLQSNRAGENRTIPPPVWSVSNADFSISGPNATATPDALAPTPPPGGATIAGEMPGTAIVTATIGGVRATIPVYYYPSIDAGCEFRATASAGFDPNAAIPASATASDLYVTGPPSGDPLDPCANAGLTDPAARAYTLHVPYGGTLATDGDDPSRPVVAGAQRTRGFPFLPGSVWRNDFTSLPWTSLVASAIPCPDAPTCPTIAGSVLVFKTAQGRIVKLSIVSFEGKAAVLGPYEVSGLDGTFPY